MDRSATRLTFEDLAAREPRLAELRNHTETAGRRRRRTDGGFCANAVWYGYSRYGSRCGEGSLRREVVALVGRNSQHPDPAMHTSEAYDVAYQTLWGILPPCDHHDHPCGWGDSLWSDN
jgi:hypothetical protein